MPPFSTPRTSESPKTSESHRFSDVFRGQRKGTLGTNGLTAKSFIIVDVWHDPEYTSINPLSANSTKWSDTQQFVSNSRRIILVCLIILWQAFSNFPSYFFFILLHFSYLNHFFSLFMHENSLCIEKSNCTLSFERFCSIIYGSWPLIYIYGFCNCRENKKHTCSKYCYIG